jgi:hypothetical protein
LSLHIRVYPISEKELTLIAKTVQQEWDEQDAMLLRQMGEDLLEFLGIAQSIIGREMHPDQKDLGLSAVTGLDQGLEVTTDRIDGRPPQTIIPPKLDDDNLGTVCFE